MGSLWTKFRTDFRRVIHKKIKTAIKTATALVKTSWDTWGNYAQLKTHFAKLIHILPLKNAWRCCYKGIFLLSPPPPTAVLSVLNQKLNAQRQHCTRGRGKGRCLNLTIDQGCSCFFEGSSARRATVESEAFRTRSEVQSKTKDREFSKYI